MKDLKKHDVDVIDLITAMLHKELCFEFLVYNTSVTLEPSTWLFWILSSNVNRVVYKFPQRGLKYGSNLVLKYFSISNMHLTSWNGYYLRFTDENL